MNTLAVRSLRIVLVILLVGSVLLQVLIPLFATVVSRTFPEVESLVIPYSGVGILAVGCVEIALLAIWCMLSLVGRGEVFTPPALRIVDVITGCGAVAGILVAAVLVHVLLVLGVGGPGVVLGLAVTVMCTVAFVLVMRVLRGLLQTAIADRAELAEVI